MNFGGEQEFLKTQHVRVQGAEAAENPGPLREGAGEPGYYRLQVGPRKLGLRRIWRSAQ